LPSVNSIPQIKHVMLVVLGGDDRVENNNVAHIYKKVYNVGYGLK
jgi:hypothetical protein